MKKILFLLFLLPAFVCRAVPDIDSIEATLQSTTQDSSKLRLLNKFAWSLLQTDRKNTERFANDALALAVKLSDEAGSEEALTTLGWTSIYNGNYQLALERFFNSLSIAEKLNDKKRIAKNFQNISNVYLNLQKTNTALEYATKALEIYQSMKNADEELSILYHVFGSVYADKKDYQKALHYYFAALEKTKGTRNELQGLSTSYSNIGNVYYWMGDYAKTLEYYQKNLDVLKKLKNDHSITIATVNMAYPHMELGNFKNAISYFEEGLRLATKLGDKDIRLNVYEGLYDVHKRAGNYSDALSYHELHVALKDSVFNLASNGQIAEIQTKYETEKKQQQIELLSRDQKVKEAEVRTQKLTRNTLVAVSFLIMGFAYWRARIKQKANKKLADAYHIISEKNKNISDSINYAQRIQQAILPSSSELEKCFPESFILYKPKDVVSGDFYAFTEKDGKAIIAAVDCTGHGVPGAFMSMIGNDQLNHIILEKGITRPSEILTNLNKGIKTALKQKDKDSGETRDGMDIAICSIDKQSGTIEFAGAMRPVYQLNGELKETSSDKMAIGGTTPEDYSYTNHNLAYKTGDAFYLFSDGYADQFGGPEGKKFMTKRFKKLLASIHEKPMQEQARILENSFLEWKGEHEQVDDILVIGFRI